jgi:hypothetical protein
MKRLMLAGGLAAAIAVCVLTPASASLGTLLDKGVDKGEGPLAFAKGTAKNHPSKLIVKVASKPKAQVDLNYDTNCSKDAKGKVREVQLTKKTPFKLGMKQAFKRPDECLVNALAGFEDGSLDGYIKIQLYARG